MLLKCRRGLQDLSGRRASAGVISGAFASVCRRPLVTRSSPKCHHRPPKRPKPGHQHQAACPRFPCKTIQKGSRCQEWNRPRRASFVVLVGSRAYRNTRWPYSARRSSSALCFPPLSHHVGGHYHAQSSAAGPVSPTRINRPPSLG
jgi:hypothetical protein